MIITDCFIWFSKVSIKPSLHSIYFMHHHRFYTFAIDFGKIVHIWD